MSGSRTDFSWTGLDMNNFQRMEAVLTSISRRISINVYGDFLKIPELPLLKVFSYLGFDDLKTLSVLSKDMRQLVFPSLISSSTFHLKTQHHLVDLLHFIQVKIKPLNQLTGLSIEPGSFKDCSALLKLFTGCGSQLSHLKVSNFYNEQVTSLTRTIIPFRNNLFPNLKSISICEKDNVSGRNYANESCAPLLRLILGNAPVLQKAKLECGGHKGITSLFFRLIEEAGLPIISLTVSGADVTENNLGYLTSLSLEKFDFTEIYKLCDSPSFTNFLVSQRHTLKHLELDLAAPKFTLPRLERLKTFKLSAFTLREMTPISFKTKAPKVKKVELKLHRNVGLEDNLACLISFEQETSSVKELILSIPGISADKIRKCLYAFNCLSKLEVLFSNELGKVWTDLANLACLEELTLFTSERTGDEGEKLEMIWIDKVLTGLPIRSQGCRSMIFRDDDIRKFEKMYDAQRSVELLKKLRLLRLRPAPNLSSRLMLTDVSFRVALSKMESLKCIDFCGTHPSFVGASKKVLDEMGKKIVLLFGSDREWHYE